VTGSLISHIFNKCTSFIFQDYNILNDSYGGGDGNSGGSGDSGSGGAAAVAAVVVYLYLQKIKMQ
jgi:hypothetical protein